MDGVRIQDAPQSLTALCGPWSETRSRELPYGRVYVGESVFGMRAERRRPRLRPMPSISVYQVAWCICCHRTAMPLRQLRWVARLLSFSRCADRDRRAFLALFRNNAFCVLSAPAGEASPRVPASAAQVWESREALPTCRCSSCDFYDLGRDRLLPDTSRKPFENGKLVIDLT